ncbi:MAG: transcription elongation factor GreA [Actinomycetota bacterium]|nr:transcription elongation factor GreA [Actinomycetota bacterium]
MSETHLSRSAYERLKQELEDLSTRGRVDIARTIQTARELGDLSENADYHAAREDQGRMELRIRQLTQLLDKAIIIEGEGGGVVANGSIVSLRYQGDDDVERYLVGSIEERREDMTVVSPSSPLGQALLGHRAGESVEYQAPRGPLTVEIVAIEG